MKTVISIRNMSKTYSRDVIDFEYGKLKIRFKGRKVEALKDLSLDVYEGEIFGLLGPNGAGKSTLIKILMTIHFPTSGTATIFGKPYWDIEVKKYIGFLPENPFFYDYLTGYEFLDFYGQLYSMSKSERQKRISEVLELVGLNNYNIDNLPLKGYSKGMLQRIGLAQAILSRPKLIILDEPLSGLDPIGRKEIKDVILKLREEGITIFFSSHILQDVETICDRVGILYKGELINVGHLNELLSAEILGYELTIESNDPVKIKEKCEKIAEKYIVQKNEIFIRFSNKVNINEIIAQCLKIDPSLKIKSLIPIRETLEDYFIRKVRR